ncbi:MAG TPA: hypothetical protein VHD56_16150 [Tepidisphaeraceae bacterium]|nr:hypothetical protein [Tepidisphaeraceae bacterium]
MSPHLGHVSALMIALGSAVTFGQIQPVATEYRPSGYPETYSAFYPGVELRALPAARAQAAVARTQLSIAQTHLNNAVSDVHRSFQHSTELRNALAEQRNAYESLKAAREQALTNLKSDTTYLATIDLRNRLSDQIEEMRAQKDPSRMQLMALATMRLSYATKVTTMEASALAADPRVKDARDRLMEAGNQVAVLEEKFDDSVRNDPAVLAARKSVEDARIAAVGTEALYTEAVNVANAAMDYAYHLYDRPYPYVIQSPYYVAGYGYSAGNGFPVGYPIGYPYNWRGMGH